MRTNHDRLVRERWQELLSRKDLIGGDILYRGYYYGGILSFRVRDGSIDFTVTWSACSTKRGWTVRQAKKVSVYQYRLDVGTPEKTYTMGDDGTIFLRGHGIVTQEQVKPQYTYLQKAAERAAKAADLGPLFGQTK